LHPLESAAFPRRTPQAAAPLPGTSKIGIVCQLIREISSLKLTEGHIMKFPRRQFLHLVVGAAVFVILFSNGAWSQATRTIRILVPIAPGGSMDILARVLGEQIGRAQGPTVLIENRTGAGGAIAAEAVSRAAPDGNTLLIEGNSFVITPQLRN